MNETGEMTEPDFQYPVFEGINGCQPVKVISEGAYGKVYLIRMINVHPNGQAALKVFNQFDAGGNKLECEREKAILQNIAMHERINGKQLQIAHLRDDIYGIDCPNLMLEHINGFDLSANLLKQRTFSTISGFITFIKNMTNQIGFGVLRDLHSMNIYHNDIKPSNIMYDPKRQLFYLIDFGLAVPVSLMHQKEFRTGAPFCTTMMFMSPWHLKLINQSRYLVDGKYKYNITDNNQTRLYAANADFYSFALTVIQLLGRHCHMANPLCFMAKQIVSMQKEYFKEEEEAFAKWDIKTIARVFKRYWWEVQNTVIKYLRWNPDNHDNRMFISTLSNWLSIGEFTF